MYRFQFNIKLRKSSDMIYPGMICVILALRSYSQLSLHSCFVALMPILGRNLQIKLMHCSRVISKEADAVVIHLPCFHIDSFQQKITGNILYSKHNKDQQGTHQF